MTTSFPSLLRGLCSYTPIRATNLHLPLPEPTPLPASPWGSLPSLPPPLASSQHLPPSPNPHLRGSHLPPTLGPGPSLRTQTPHPLGPHALETWQGCCRSLRGVLSGSRALTRERARLWVTRQAGQAEKALLSITADPNPAPRSHSGRAGARGS